VCRRSRAREERGILTCLSDEDSLPACRWSLSGFCSGRTVPSYTPCGAGIVLERGDLDDRPSQSKVRHATPDPTRDAVAISAPFVAQPAGAAPAESERRESTRKIVAGSSAVTASIPAMSKAPGEHSSFVIGALGGVSAMGWETFLCNSGAYGLRGYDHCEGNLRWRSTRRATFRPGEALRRAIDRRRDHYKRAAEASFDHFVERPEQALSLFPEKRTECSGPVCSLFPAEVTRMSRAKDSGVVHPRHG